MNTSNPLRPLCVGANPGFHLFPRLATDTMCHFLDVSLVHFSHSGTPKTLLSVYLLHALHVLESTLGTTVRAVHVCPSHHHFECRYASHLRHQGSVLHASAQMALHTARLTRARYTNSSGGRKLAMCLSTSIGRI